MKGSCHEDCDCGDKTKGERGEILQIKGKEKGLNRTLYKIGKVYLYCAFGGIGYGIYDGLRYGQRGTFKLGMNAVVNSIGQNFIKIANQGGAIAILYFGIRMGVRKATEKTIKLPEHSPYNNLLAATMAGCVYKSLRGPRRMAVYGLTGLSLSLLQVLWNTETVVNIRSKYSINPMKFYHEVRYYVENKFKKEEEGVI